MRKTHDANMRLTTVPFSGFYETWHSEEIQHTAEQAISDDCGDPIGDLAEHLFDAIEYRDVEDKYAAGYVENFAYEFELTALEFDEVSRPREYNFTTDRVFAWISRSDLYHILLNLPLSLLAKHAKARFTSYDGFISSYSPDVTDWPEDVGDWDHNQIGTLLEAWAEHMHGEEFDQHAEFELMERDMGNGVIDSWLCETSDKFVRLCNIAYYLRQRAERRH